MSEADVHNRVNLLLASKSAQKIDFELEGTHFVGSQLTRVAAAILTRRIGIGFGRTMTKGAAAEYDPINNVFRFPGAQTKSNFAMTTEERAMILHECVHAWCDVSVPTVGTAMHLVSIVRGPMTKLTSEALAYVAMCLYYIYDLTDAGNDPAKSTWAADEELYGTAFGIANKIKNKPGAVVHKDDVLNLKVEIMNDPRYSDIQANPALIAGFNGA
jgi:hypothetical protein